MCSRPKNDGCCDLPLQLWSRFTRQSRTSRTCPELLQRTLWFSQQLRSAIVQPGWPICRRRSWEGRVNTCPKHDQVQCLRLVEELEKDAIDWAAVASAWVVERGCGAVEDATLIWRGRAEPHPSWFLAWPRRPGVQVTCRPRPITVSILLRVPADIALVPTPAAPAGEGPLAAHGAGPVPGEFAGDGGGLPFGGLCEDGVHPCGGLLGDDFDEWSPAEVPEAFPSAAGRAMCGGPSPAVNAGSLSRPPSRSHCQPPREWAGRPGWPVSSSPSPTPSWDEEAGEWEAAAATAARARGDEDDDVEPSAPAPPPDLFCADLGPLEMWAGSGNGHGRSSAAGGASLSAAVPSATAAAAAGFDDDVELASSSECLLTLGAAALAEAEAE
jgi:hypothetical protein